MPEYQLYDAKVSLLTPLHIGTGETLLHGYDYTIHGKRTWRLNQDRLLDAQDVDDPALAATLAAQPPGDLVADGEYDAESDLFRYVIRGTPRSRAKNAQVSEQLKDAFDRPYLPGSSLKGALRTALAWVAWGQRGLRPDRRKLKSYYKFAAQTYERELFGRDPNHDLFRALQVSDSAPVGADRLMVANAQVLHRSGKPASPVEVEALQPDTVFALTIKIDTALFSDWAGSRGLRGGELLTSLPDHVQAHAAQRIATETDWFDGVPGARRILDFYQKLPREGLPPTMCLLQVGGGTGWDDKTFGSRLREDQRFMEGILRDYRLARGKRRPGDPFPKSRRVVMGVQRRRDGRRVERPRSPLGWVLLELTPR
jgi:CRISPR-associated protein Csm5